MIVYNTTFHIDKAREEEGLAYLRTCFIPQAVAGGSLLRPRLMRVMHTDDAEGSSYSVQFHVADEATLEAWYRTAGVALHRQLAARFGEQMVGFSTLLEVIDGEL